MFVDVINIDLYCLAVFENCSEKFYCLVYGAYRTVHCKLIYPKYFPQPKKLFLGPGGQAWQDRCRAEGGGGAPAGPSTLEGKTSSRVQTK